VRLSDLEGWLPYLPHDREIVAFFPRRLLCFAADASNEDVAFLRDSQLPIDMSVFSTKLNDAAWRTKPSWAVIATDDKAFDQLMLRNMAERIGATITEVAASHVVFMTQPKVVADVIDRAAQGAVAAAR
jgi:pimeloyl-ACP methyl ester carboxylesterase